jgi:hypothetical protein
VKINKFVSLGLVLTVFPIFCLGFRAAWCAETENHCFTCHTNPRKLSQITREIARNTQGKPGGSVETTGEG